jgi:YihY family inner membrane protein
MNVITVATRRIDRFQQSHPSVAFVYAVIKKYGDDNGSYLAALITYYGFLSLFPLLLVLVTVLQLAFDNNPDVQRQVAQTINNYLPLMGKDVQSNISSSHKTGIGLLVGTLITLYGARGAADTLRYVMDTVWHIPKQTRSGFPKNLLKSLSIMGIGALGFIAAVGASVATSALGSAWWVEVLFNIAGFSIVSATLLWAFRAAASHKLPYRHLVAGSVCAGLLSQLLLTFGSLILASQIRSFDTLYGTFAVVLGLLVWIYLLAQVLVYAAEVNTVIAYRLWPRGLDGKRPTAADKHAYTKAAETQKYIPPEEIDVSFKDRK